MAADGKCAHGHWFLRVQVTGNFAGIGAEENLSEPWGLCILRRDRLVAVPTAVGSADLAAGIAHIRPRWTAYGALIIRAQWAWRTIVVHQGAVQSDFPAGDDPARRNMMWLAWRPKRA